MPGRTTDKSDKLDRLLAEAAAIFARKGYHSTTMRDIAAETEVSLAGLYYYFKAKEEILFLISERCFDAVIARGEKAVATEASAEERLGALVAQSERVDPGDPAWRRRAERRAWLSRWWPSLIG